MTKPEAIQVDAAELRSPESFTALSGLLKAVKEIAGSMFKDGPADADLPDSAFRNSTVGF